MRIIKKHSLSMHTEIVLLLLKNGKNAQYLVEELISATYLGVVLVRDVPGEHMRVLRRGVCDGHQATDLSE